MKILVIYATAGAGHRKAAEAIYNGFKSSTDEDVVLVDSLDYTNPFYKNVYSQSYTFLISKIPWLWAWLFYLIDISWLVPFVRFGRRLQNSLNARALSRYLQEQQFDCIFSTHFFPNEVAAYLKRNGKIKSKVVCSITDYDVHSIWLSKGIDLYTVATDWTAKKLRKLGIADSQMTVTGIPTDENFSVPKNISELKQSIGIKENVFTVLVATGSFGIGPIEEIIRQLAGFQIIVVCGHNKSLYQRLSEISQELVKICGLVDNMYELMAVSDVMITKPGGLSTSEALVVGLPLVFFNAIPGQETNNIKVLQQYGVGISGCSIVEMARVLKQFQSSPEDFQIARQKSKALGKPLAVRDIMACAK